MVEDLETGEVPRSIVIEVLEACGVTVAQDEQTPILHLIKGDVIDSRELDDWVDRDVLQSLRRKFGIQMHLFYHPEVLRDAKGKTEKA